MGWNGIHPCQPCSGDVWSINSKYLSKYPLEAYTNGLVQERRNSSVLAMELRISCTNQSVWKLPDILMVIWVWPKHVIDIWFYITSIHVTFSILPKFIISRCNVICDMMLQKVSTCQEFCGACFNIKMVCHWYRKSHCGVKTASRSSYLQVIHKIILSSFSFTGMIASLYYSSTFITLTS